MTHHPDVEVPRWTSTDHRPYVECAHDECSTRLRLDLTFPMTPESVYGELGAAGWTADPARCPAHRPDVYELMSEDDRRAAVNYLMEQARHLEDFPRWNTEDACITAESLLEIYNKHIAPHEFGDVTCKCGNSRHPEVDPHLLTHLTEDGFPHKRAGECLACEDRAAEADQEAAS